MTADPATVLSSPSPAQVPSRPSETIRRARRRLAVINVVGGIAVLGSYVTGLAGNPDTRGDLWGGVPEALLGLYTMNMFLAAAGYLALTSYVYFQLLPRGAQVRGVPLPGLATLAYLAVLIPSALWLPLTFEMLAQPSATLWVAIRIDLALVALGSLGLLALVLLADPRGGAVARWAAIVGGLFFCLQTVVLDAIVWTAFFPFPAA